MPLNHFNLRKMEDKIVERLRKIESNIKAYNTFVNSPSSNVEDRKIVSFTLLYEMMAFKTLQEFAPGDYEPSETTELTVANALKDATNYVSINDNNNVVIAPEYKALLKQRDEWLKNKN